MKRWIAFFASLVISIMAHAWTDSGIKVWGQVDESSDGQHYLTMYKNCPARVSARFHFKYKGGGESEEYDIIMADTVAVLHDPVPVERAVRKVVMDMVVYMVPDNGPLASDGWYSTTDPNDDHMLVLLPALYDSRPATFWFEKNYRASYYHGRYYSGFEPEPVRVGGYDPARHDGRGESGVPEKANSSRGINSGKIMNLDTDKYTGNMIPDDDSDMTELSDNDLLLIAGAAVALTAGMGVVVSKNWKVPDNRYPYFSTTAKTDCFFSSGLLRDVVQLKYRFGGKAGCSVFGDFGYTQGTLLEPKMFDRDYTYSFGASLDYGNFSISLSGKPRSGGHMRVSADSQGQPCTYSHSENFAAFQLGYDIQFGRHCGMDIDAGIAVLWYKDKEYLDYPLSLGLFYRF